VTPKHNKIGITVIERSGHIIYMIIIVQIKCIFKKNMTPTYGVHIRSKKTKKRVDTTGARQKKSLFQQYSKKQRLPRKRAKNMPNGVQKSYVESQIEKKKNNTQEKFFLFMTLKKKCKILLSFVWVVLVSSSPSSRAGQSCGGRPLGAVPVRQATWVLLTSLRPLVCIASSRGSVAVHQVAMLRTWSS
jgi:hypothetical protein